MKIRECMFGLKHCDGLLFGFCSRAKNQGKPEEWKKWWENEDSEHYYFMAKDNIPAPL